MLYKIVVHSTHANKANYIFAGYEPEIFHGDTTNAEELYILFS